VRAFKDIIVKLDAERDHYRRLQLLEELNQALESVRSVEERKYLKSLLYHPDWYIRREVAFLIDRYGVPLDESERFQFAYALQNFQYLADRMTDERARSLLFQACEDASPKIRALASEYIQLDDCKTLYEEALLHYACGDYLALLELGCTTEGKDAVVAVLKKGLNQEGNPNYHRRQCAFCLEQLKAISSAESVIHELLSAGENASETSSDQVTPMPHWSPLEQLLYTLNQQGVRVDGKRLYPRIEIGSVTGRITYKQPPLQTWPKEVRWQRIQADPGKLLLRLDYRCMEPRVMLHFLVEAFLISLDEIPDEDIYLAVNPENREAGKRWLNTLINGGMVSNRGALNVFQRRLIEAVQEFRQELINRASRLGFVETLGGRRIPLPENETNVSGKIMNRLIQGSASDIFNSAVARLYLRFVEGMEPARIIFLLFDEVWIEVDPKAVKTVQEIAQEILQTVPQEMGLLLPLPVRCSFSNPMQNQENP